MTSRSVLPWRSRSSVERAASAADLDLAAGFRTGDAAAVRAVYDRYAGPVFTVAFSLLGDRELAADAVQITFLKAWRAAASVDDTRALAPWLYAIARRVAIDLYRAQRRSAPAAGEEEVIVLPPSFERSWEAWQIRTAIDALPAAEREVVRAQHYLDLTHSQIAARLQVPIGTVKSRSHRAHRRLAGLLSHLVEVTP